MVLPSPLATLGSPPASEDSKVAVGEPKVASGDSKVVGGEPKVASGDSKVAGGEPKVAGGNDKVTILKSEIATEEVEGGRIASE